MEVLGKHALITGAGKRIGRTIASHLLQAGAAVTAHYHRSESEALDLVAQAETQGSRAVAVQANLQNRRSIETAVEHAVETLGPIDILINSASLFYATPALDCEADQWDELLAVNLKGQFFFAQSVAPSMLKRGGVILNIIDVYADKPSPGFCAYVAAKGGLLALTKTLAKEWAPAIRVNAISPGPVLAPHGSSAEQQSRSADSTLFKRLGSPDDIVEAVRFLIGNDYITGINLKVDGGRSLT